MGFQKVWMLLKDAFNEWSAANGSRLGAALAYYSVFSIAPLLILTLSVASMVFDEKAARENIADEIEGTVGRPVAVAIQDILKNNDQAQTTTATVIGVVILLIGAMGVFSQLQDALNTIWRVEAKPSLGIWGLIRDRVASMTMVMTTGFLLLVSLIVSTVLSAVSEYLTQSMPGGATLWLIINTAITFGVIMFLFALIYKYVPDVQVAWKDVWVGAAMTAVLFSLGKYVLGWYLGQASTTSAYGAAGSLVVILLWVYYASQIMLFGAAFTRVYATHVGSGFRPSTHAVSTESKACREQPQAA